MLLSRDRLLQVVQDHWAPGPVEVLSWHQTVPTQVVARVSTSREELAVKIDTRPHASVIGGEDVQAHVAALRPDLAPRPVPTASGVLAVADGSHRYTISEWVEGELPPDEPEVWRRVGAALGHLHNLPPVPRPFAVPIDGVCDELLKQPDWPPALVAEVVRRARGLSSGPTAVVHGQPSLANVRGRDQAVPGGLGRER